MYMQIFIPFQKTSPHWAESPSFSSDISLDANSVIETLLFKSGMDSLLILSSLNQPHFLMTVSLSKSRHSSRPMDTHSLQGPYGACCISSAFLWTYRCPCLIHHSKSKGCATTSEQDSLLIGPHAERQRMVIEVQHTNRSHRRIAEPP